MVNITSTFVGLSECLGFRVEGLGFGVQGSGPTARSGRSRVE